MRRKKTTTLTWIKITLKGKKDKTLGIQMSIQSSQFFIITFRFSMLYYHATCCCISFRYLWKYNFAISPLKILNLANQTLAQNLACGAWRPRLNGDNSNTHTSGEHQLQCIRRNLKRIKQKQQIKKEILKEKRMKSQSCWIRQLNASKKKDLRCKYRYCKDKTTAFKHNTCNKHTHTHAVIHAQPNNEKERTAKQLFTKVTQNSSCIDLDCWERSIKKYYTKNGSKYSFTNLVKDLSANTPSVSWVLNMKTAGYLCLNLGQFATEHSLSFLSATEHSLSFLSVPAAVVIRWSCSWATKTSAVSVSSSIVHSSSYLAVINGRWPGHVWQTD